MTASQTHLLGTLTAVGDSLILCTPTIVDGYACQGHRALSGRLPARQLSDKGAPSRVLGIGAGWAYTEVALDSPHAPHVADYVYCSCAGCAFCDFSQRFAGSPGEDTQKRPGRGDLPQEDASQGSPSDWTGDWTPGRTTGNWARDWPRSLAQAGGEREAAHEAA